MCYIVTGGCVEANGIDADAGTILANTCTCDECGHVWHPRNLNDDFVVDK